MFTVTSSLYLGPDSPYTPQVTRMQTRRDAELHAAMWEAKGYQTVIQPVEEEGA